MRIFVGIPISQELQGRILEWEDKHQEPIFKNQTNSKNQISNPIRCVAGKNLHVTLAPPWETGEWKVESEKSKV